MSDLTLYEQAIAFLNENVTPKLKRFNEEKIKPYFVETLKNIQDIVDGFKFIKDESLHIGNVLNEYVEKFGKWFEPYKNTLIKFKDYLWFLNENENRYKMNKMSF
jgi:hypothetical protein